VDNAKGEWACFVDSDDELLPNGLQIMVDGISEEVDLVMAGYETFDDNGALIYSVDTKVSKVITSIDAVKELFEPSDYWYQGYIWGKLYRLSGVRNEKIRFSEDVYFNEDRLYLARFICAMERGIYYSTIPVYMYFEREGGAMMSLKDCFNIKFVTDMEAQIRIKDCVRSRFDSLELLELADFEVYKSYRRIVGMIKESQYNDMKLSARLFKRLIGSIGLASFAKYEIKRNKRRLLNKIKKL
jgi:glycosyltransferase involved in cell wall biosynthesis